MNCRVLAVTSNQGVNFESNRSLHDLFVVDTVHSLLEKVHPIKRKKVFVRLFSKLPGPLSSYSSGEAYGGATSDLCKQWMLEHKVSVGLYVGSYQEGMAFCVGFSFKQEGDSFCVTYHSADIMKMSLNYQSKVTYTKQNVYDESYTTQVMAGLKDAIEAKLKNSSAFGFIVT